MKKSLLLIPLLLLGSFALASDETSSFPAFPMTIHGNIKIWSSNLAGWTLRVYNSSNQELAYYNITQNGKYWSDNVSIEPLLLNKFDWSLNFKVSYNWKTFVVDSIDDSNRWEWCPSKDSIIFKSNNCRYDITLKEEVNPTQWNYSWWWWKWKSNSDSSTKTNKTDTTKNANTTVSNWDTNTHNAAAENWKKATNIKGDRVPAQVFTFKQVEYNNWNPSEKLENWYTREMNNAYKFAYSNWLTTSKSIEKFKVNSPLTRIAMAKILSNYAINILWKKPDTSKWTVKFDDVTAKQNAEYDNAVNLAYQLWIMWQNVKNNKFRPNDEVTRAEFVTALSRLLYWTQDWKPYYSTHINVLKQKWIISNDNPKIKEKRGYVMVMLMRTSK